MTYLGTSSLGQWFVIASAFILHVWVTVLVPILVGLNPGIALFSSGVALDVHPDYAREDSGVYGMSFIHRADGGLDEDDRLQESQGRWPGLVYLIVAVIVALAGSDWINKVLPPIVVGPMIMVIGLSLAGSAAQKATVDSSGTYHWQFFLVAMITLLLTVAFNLYLKGFLALIPILLGIVVGYLVGAIAGLVDFKPVLEAAWFQLPKFEFPGVSYPLHFYWGAVLSLAPIAFVTMTEHIGHITVLNELTHRNFFEDPGLHHTLAGDGLASIVASLVGGPPVTSYGENVGVLAITRVHSVYVLIGAAVFAIIFSFVGKLSALIESIPNPVIGGISFLLFGVIASSGMRILIEKHVDFNKRRNLMIASSILVIGIGNAYLKLGQYEFSGLPWRLYWACTEPDSAEGCLKKLR